MKQMIYVRGVLDRLDCSVFDEIEESITTEDRAVLDVVYLNQHPFDDNGFSGTINSIAIECYEACNLFSARDAEFDSFTQDVERIAES